MKPKNKLTSPIDSIIIDMILDHFNIQSLSGKREQLSGETFKSICQEAEKIYYKHLMIKEDPGFA